MTNRPDAPAIWPKKRLKFCATYNDEVLPESTDDFEQIDYVEISDVSLVEGIRASTPMLFHEAPSRARRKVRKGDILVSTVRTYLKAIATVTEATDNLTASTGFCVIRPSAGLDPGYAGWVAKSDAFVDELVSRSVGVSYPAINASQVVDILVPVPPLNVQRRIAAFLDERTAQIDALIAKKQALLDRLSEKYQSIVTQAVTKGLNPDAPLKESGVDWVGRIPIHWEVKRLKYLTDAPLKYGANAPAEWEDAEWPRFIRITDVDQSGNLRPDTFRSLPPEIAEPYLLSEGDILLARSGATVGKSFIYRRDWGKACFAGYLILARINKDHSAEFVYNFLNSDAFWSWVRASFIQSTIQNVNAEKYANLWVPCPPLSEQREITSIIRLRRKEILYHERKIEKSLQLLTEYRSAIITSAVNDHSCGLI